MACAEYLDVDTLFRYQTSSIARTVVPLKVSGTGIGELLAVRLECA